MNFYNLLFDGGANPDNFYETLFAEFLTNNQPTIFEYIGTVPHTIITNGQPLIDYTIYGNMVQSGTPTPENPITPGECGTLINSQWTIPIISAGHTNNIYLGNVQTNRYVRKQVLTGTENWIVGRAGTVNEFYAFTQTVPTVRQGFGMCTHYDFDTITMTNTSIGIYVVQAGGVRVRDTRFNSVDDFKTWLVQQYANGTPVTVWYVLANPETVIVNEPIRKIGNYADAVSYGQAEVSIPTNNGSTVIDVDTTLKPSEVYIKYYGG